MRGVRQSNVRPYTSYIFEEISRFVCLFCLFSYFSQMVFTSYSLTYRLIGKKDPVAPQDEKKYICLLLLSDGTVRGMP